MQKLTPTINTLHRVAGEGNFNIYRQLKEGRRFFLLAKCLTTTWSYYHGRGEHATEKTVAFVKGPNQLRYQKQVMEQLKDEFGSVEIFMSAPINSVKSDKFLPRIDLQDVAQQIIYLLCMFMTGRRRFLNLYLLSFSAAINKVLKEGMRDVENFICFNDQPYDVAAVVHALNNKKNTRTIVIQHGLVLSEKFYFPTVAQEFWGWGDLSKKHYRSWSAVGRIKIMGRYKTDIEKKSNFFNELNMSGTVKLLIAPSYSHAEVLNLISKVKEIFSENDVDIKLGLKLHPSTKFSFYLALKSKVNQVQIKLEGSSMEDLVEKYDALITVNSTSSIDFLLRGKPVFFSEIFDPPKFPSVEYGCNLIDLEGLAYSRLNILQRKNDSRLSFLMSSINV